jgi:hypothetical protein
MNRRNPVRTAAKALSCLVREHANPCMMLVVSALTLPLYVFGEKISIGYGLGYDGQTYGQMVRAGLAMFRGTDSYYVQRVLPSLMVRLCLDLFSVVPTNQSIIAGFIGLNVLCLAAVALLWGLIADELGISYRGKWLGFSGLFLSFAVLKFASYYPVLTDIPALAVSTALLYFYLRRARLGLLLSMLLGAFTWPTTLYMGAALLVFPRKPDTELKSALSDSATVRGAVVSPRRPILRVPRSLKLPQWSTILASAVAGALGVVCFILLLRGYDPQAVQKTAPIAVHALGACVGIAYVFHCVKYLLRSRPKASLLRFWINVGSPVYVAIALTMVAVLRLLVFGSFPRSRTDDAIRAWVSWVGSSYHLPGIFLVAHVVWFGPIVVLALFCWKSVLRHMGEYGFGLLLVCVLGLMMSLNSESHQGITFLPMVVTFTVLAADLANWTSRRLAVFAILSLLWSKVWLTIGPVRSPGAPGALNLYFMNAGPWMTHVEYVFQLGLVLLLAGLLWVTVPRSSDYNRAETRISG